MKDESNYTREDVHKILVERHPDIPAEALHTVARTWENLAWHMKTKSITVDVISQWVEHMNQSRRFVLSTGNKKTANQFIAEATTDILVPIYPAEEHDELWKVIRKINPPDATNSENGFIENEEYIN
jgi:hypothetical protein